MFSTQAPIAVAVATALSLPSVAVAARAPSPDPSKMSNDEKIDRAKQLFGEADAAFQDGEYETALAKFEEAYNVYAPSFHLFNFNIGTAAYELGDCAKAKTAFQRFLDLIPENDLRSTAQEKLLEIERSGCANKAKAPAPSPAVAQTQAPMDDDDDAPLLTSKRDEREEASQRERETKDAERTDPLVLSGIVLTSLGGAALIGSAISLGLANNKANRLADLASAGPTGFPDGNYSDDEVFNLDQAQLPANNATTVALLAGGIAVAGTGAVLLGVGLKRQKAKRAKLGDSRAAAPHGPTLVGLGPSIVPNGGGAAASVRF